MKRKNILFISSWFPNKNHSTSGNFVQRHAEAVALVNNVEVLHAIGNKNQTEKFVIEDKIINEIRTLIIYYKNTEIPILNFLRRMQAYRKGFIRMKKADLVHANVMHNSMLFAVWLKKIHKIPFVITEHWTALRSKNKDTTPFAIKKIAELIGNQAAKVLPVSNDLKEGLTSLGIRTSMQVVPNVVDTVLFSPKLVEKTGFTFIHVSDLIPRKNAEKILKVALTLLDKGYQFKLEIGGDGNTTDLQNRVKISNHESKIEIFGTQTLENVAKRMRNADCFLLFSEDENQPCVIAESFASGIPVISTNVGGIAEFFPANGGILLDSTDMKLLEDAMVKVLNTKNWHSNALVQYAKSKFSKEIIAKEYSKIYDEILGK